MREQPEESELLVSADIELYDRYAPVILSVARSCLIEGTYQLSSL